MAAEEDVADIALNVEEEIEVVEEEVSSEETNTQESVHVIEASSATTESIKSIESDPAEVTSEVASGDQDEVVEYPEKDILNSGQGEILSVPEVSTISSMPSSSSESLVSGESIINPLSEEGDESSNLHSSSTILSAQSSPTKESEVITEPVSDPTTEVSDSGGPNPEAFPPEEVATDEVVGTLPEDELEEGVVFDNAEFSLTTTDNSNRYQFGTNECVSVGNGSYYCNTVPTDDLVVDSEDAVYASVTASGYHEIFLRSDSRVVQITDNQHDDLGPTYDPISHSISWHRMLDGRYQIITHNIKSGREAQLTDSAENNMQPVRAGETVVWQRWIDDYWQIILFDGEAEIQLTNNERHNVAPHINGGYVIWNTTSLQGERQIAVYEIASRLISYIDDDEGGYITNPRFVLVYDTTFDNGDVVTKGYDPETGAVTPLSKFPRIPTPNIPSPDPVDEARALLNNKQSTGREELMEADIETPPATTTETSQETEDTLVIEQTMSTASSAISSILVLDEYDLVITPYTETVALTEMVSSTQSNDSGTD